MPQTRQLAAIMFTDIVGYTALMQKNEQQALALLKANRVILNKIVANHEGDVVEYYGDGSLCVFSSVTEALNCAVDLQKELQGDPKVPLRIGLHVGEILFDDGKVIGDGINLASRIQALGLPGSVLFSREIFNKIRNHSEFKAVPLGTFLLKNVEEPMEVFALANEGLNLPDPGQIEGNINTAKPKEKRSLFKKPLILAGILLAIVVTAFALFQKKRSYDVIEKSIAVLPFKNISNDTLQEYFSDGITEDIITQLSKIAGLRVISATSVMPYKNASANLRQIADELQVGTILEGSVRREGNQVRITAQLIDARSDGHIWASNYDRNISEVFTIQSEVAQEIANELNVRLSKDEGARIQQKATTNVLAYEDYLLARHSRWDEAEKLLMQAIQKDSSFALAWASLALVYSKKYGSDSVDRPYYIRKSLDAALRAVDLGPDLSETHMILGDVLKVVTLSPALAIRELKKSVALNPNSAEAYVYLAFAYTELGRFAEAEENLKRATQLDPRSGLMKIAWRKLYYSSRNPDKLLQYAEEFSTTDTRWLMIGARLHYHFLKNNYDSMFNYFDSLPSPDLKAIAFIKTGKPVEALAIIDSLNTVDNKNAVPVASIYAWLGDNKKAMEYLNIAYRLNDYSLTNIKVDKPFDPLRGDPEFKKLLMKLGME